MHDERLPQPPEERVFPPANEPKQQINTRKNRQIFQEAETAAIEPKDGGQQSSGCHCSGDQIGPREAAPKFLKLSSEGCHRSVNRNNTLPESSQRMQRKRLIIGRQANLDASPARSKQVLLWLGVADAAVVTAVSEINHQSDRQPDEQTGPVDPGEFVHHVAVEEDAENRHDRKPR